MERGRSTFARVLLLISLLLLASCATSSRPIDASGDALVVADRSNDLLATDVAPSDQLSGGDGPVGDQLSPADGTVDGDRQQSSDESPGDDVADLSADQLADLGSDSALEDVALDGDTTPPDTSGMDLEAPDDAIAQDAGGLDSANGDDAASGDTTPDDVSELPETVEDAPPAVLPRTGRLVSRAPGDDGDLRRGLPWPIPRFVDHADGTFSDRLTGLMWFRRVDCLGAVEKWSDAVGMAALVNVHAVSCDEYVADYDDWRLANIVELDSLSLLDAADPGLFVLPPNADTTSFFSWSATSVDGNDALVYHLQSGYDGSGYGSLELAVIGPWPKDYTFAGWPIPGVFLVRGAANGPTHLWQSGQTTIHVAGDDGDRRAGFSGPSPRFSDLGDGTVRDETTGLIWLKDAGCFQTPLSWIDALSAVTDLNTGTTSCSEYTAGKSDWRLPNRRELLSLVRFGPTALPVGVFLALDPNARFWSSTDQDRPHSKSGKEGRLAYALQLSGGRFERLWVAYLSLAEQIVGTLPVAARVWPVRGGPALGLHLEPAALSFPQTAVGLDSAPLLVTVTNIGVVPQPIGTLVSDTPAFRIGADGCSMQTLEPLASCTFAVTFKPPSAGDFQGLIVLLAGTTLKVAGSGGGPNLSLSATELDFGLVAFGSSKTLPLTITNSGDGTTAILPTFSFVGSDPSSFGIAQNGCTATLGPGESCQVLVEMLGSDPGPRSASLDVSALGYPALSRSVTLKGQTGAL